MIETIRASLEHLDGLVPLFEAYRSFYGHQAVGNEAREFLTGRIRHEESAIFLARSGKQPAGFTQLYPLFSSVNLCRIWLLNDLYVSERARRCGVATALLDAATEHARRSGAHELLLQTGRDNVAAQALYEHGGWRRQDDYYWYDLGL